MTGLVTLKLIYIANNEMIGNNKRMYFAVKKIEKPIPEEITQAFPKEHRAREFYSSRLALKEALQKLDTEKTFKLLDLKSTDHCKLDNNPSIIVSFSHSKDFGAAICADSSQYISVGIDIELKDRNLRKGVEKMFINENDEENDLLSIWCKKEAAFKAIEPLKVIAKTLVLKDIWIKGNMFGIGDKPLGSVEMVAADNALLTSIAYISTMIK